MVDVQQLLKLNDFKELDEAALIDIAQHAGIDAHKRKFCLQADEFQDNSIYLLEGEVEIQGEGGINQTFDNTTERAQAPLFRVNSPGLHGCCKTPCKMLYVNKSYIDKYGIYLTAKQQDIAVEELGSIADLDIRQSLVSEILEKFNGDKVNLPSLPEVALNINYAIEDEDVSFTKLAGLLQTDPGVTARVIQVANSALYGVGKQTRSIQDAISRIGLSSIRTIVLCVVLRELFTPKNKLIKKSMAQFYEHSLRVGAICYDLAKRIPNMDPDHGFLVGLLHDIGTIPVLVIADGHPDLVHQAGHLEAAVRQLKGHIGNILLKQWQFADEYAYIARHAYEWKRDIETADYCDLVQVALLHEQFVGGDKYDAPTLSNLPAFKRLNMEEVDPTENILLLKNVSKRIKEMINLLCN